MIKFIATFFLFIFICEVSYGKGDKRFSIEDYIERFAEVAIEEMKKYDIPASITLAQGCLESGNGNSTLAKKANNHFGIKCNNSWHGPSVRHDDDKRNECFRKYKNAWESYRDHSKFLTGNQRYSFLFNLKVEDYKSWAKGLKKAGYATDSKYPTRLISIIEEHKLYEYDGYYKKNFKGKKSKRKKEKSRGSDKEIKDIDNFTISPYSKRDVDEINGREYVIATGADSYERIADEFDLKEWMIFTFNNVRKEANPPEGSIIFIQSKRGKAAKGQDFHILQAGEGMWHVSQQYGIRLRALYRKNRMIQGEPLKVGQKIWLIKRKPRN
jgi:hypothetical protein